MSCSKKENTLKRPIDPDRLLQYDNIRFVVNGEPYTSEVLNRPAYDLIKNIADKYYDNKQLSSPDGASYIGTKTGIDGITTIQELIDYIRYVMNITVTVGDGLVGGGPLTSNITIGVDPAFYGRFVQTGNVNQLVRGTKEFENPPKTNATPTQHNDVVTKGYVENVYAHGANQFLKKTAVIQTGGGLLGGGVIADGVTLTVDEAWLRLAMLPIIEPRMRTMIADAVAAAMPDPTPEP